MNLEINSIETKIDEARELSNSLGEKFTLPRETVFRFLLNNSVPQKAYEIIEKISISDKNAKPPTIYRALDFLCRLGLIHKIESDATYFVCSHRTQCHHETHVPLVLICQKCNQVIERHIYKIESLIAASAANDGFILNKTLIEVHGICKSCANSN